MSFQNLFKQTKFTPTPSLSPDNVSTNVTMVDGADLALWSVFNLPTAGSDQLSAALKAALAAVDSSWISRPQITILSSFLSGINAAAAAAAVGLTPEQKKAVYDVYCSLIKSTRTDATTARSDLGQLLAGFNFAITPGSQCELNDQLLNFCPAIVSRVSNLLPRNINGKSYLSTGASSTDPYFALPPNLLGDTTNNASVCQKVQFTVLSSSQWYEVATLDILTDTIYAFNIDNQNLGEIISNPVRFKVINFNQKLVDRRARCAYWSGADWQSGLCTVENQAGLDAGQDDFVACACSHLSSYAVVIDRQPASLVGYNLWFFIPLGIAAGIYLFVVIANCFFASNISQFSAHLQLHMLIAVLVFHIIYIINAALSPSTILVNSKAQSNDKCIAISVIQTYFLLCQFFWMLAQSVNYWKVLVMNDEHTNRNYHVFIIVGWVVPAVWVLVCTVVSYAVFHNYFPTIEPEQLVGSVNNNGFICYIKQLYVMLIVVLLPIVIVVIGLLFVFVNAYQVLPQWAMYDDICKGRPNHKEVRNLLIYWALVLGCTLFGALHMAFANLWWLIIYAILELIAAAFAFTSFFALRGPAALCRTAAGANIGQSYEIQEEWDGLGDFKAKQQTAAAKGANSPSGEGGNNGGSGGDTADEATRRSAALLDHLQLVKEINEDRWSDQQPHFNGGQTLTFDAGDWRDAISSPGYGRVDLPDDLEGEADVDGDDVEVEVNDNDGEGEGEDNDDESNAEGEGDFDDLIYALKSETAGSDTEDDEIVDEEDDADSGTVVSGPASDRQSQQNWRMTIADTHL